MYTGTPITRETYEILYGALCKLLAYEETGLTPEEIENLNDFEKSQVGKMLKRLNEEQRKHRWIPVEERMPEDESEVLVSINTGHVFTGYYEDGEWYIPVEPDYPIAWMPLPEPYEKEGEMD